MPLWSIDHFGRLAKLQNEAGCLVHIGNTPRKGENDTACGGEETAINTRNSTRFAP
jgi:hypothetical protein